MTQMLKERYAEKPIYDLIILPFEHEEATEERAIQNTATCLKSAYSVADAVILVDNQRYISKDASILSNMAKINRLIAEPFYNLLCAGEEKKGKYVGSKTMDAGDIIRTLQGWTVVGHGMSPLPKFKLPFVSKTSFRDKNERTLAGVKALDEAVSDLSLSCRLSDAGSVLFLVTAPASEMNMDLIKELGAYLRSKATNAVIRNGDYPRNTDALNVNVIISGLNNLDKVKNYYTKSADLYPVQEQRKRRNC